MSTAINIQITNSCINCLRCKDVCPSEVFVYEKLIIAKHSENCIECGHCIGVCPIKPLGAIEHSSFKPENIVEVDFNKYPSAEQMMEIIKGRRSNRSFTKKSVPQDKLDQIIQAAYLAPTATNTRNIRCVQVTDPKTLREITDFTMGTFSKILKLVDNAVVRYILKRFAPTIYRYIPTFKQMLHDHNNGGDPILRNATSAIFFYSPKNSRFGVEDSNLAYQNASLMAEALGISQVYTGFICTAIKQNKQRYINKLLKIDGHIHAGMALGIPKHRISRTYRKP